MRNGFSGPHRASFTACSAPSWQQTKKNGDASVFGPESIDADCGAGGPAAGWEGEDDGGIGSDTGSDKE